MKKKKKKKPELFDEEEYFGFYFIAGYTDGGVPYGITLEEAEENGWLKEDEEISSEINDSLPF